jgi:hypothetical protein
MERGRSSLKLTQQSIEMSHNSQTDKVSHAKETNPRRRPETRIDIFRDSVPTLLRKIGNSEPGEDESVFGKVAADLQHQVKLLQVILTVREGTSAQMATLREVQALVGEAAEKIRSLVQPPPPVDGTEVEKRTSLGRPERLNSLRK